MKRSTSRSRQRRGFTLLELLVVVGIIAVLLAMLVPAVQKLREVASRTQCVNNLRQIGMAMTNHFGTHQSFPTNGGFGGNPQFNLASTVGAPGSYMWGMGDPSQGPKTQTGSWAYALLPYMEENTVFSGQAFGATVPLYVCPSRSRPSAQFVPDADPLWAGWVYTHADQSGNPMNPPTGWAKTDYAANYLMIPNRGTASLSAFRGGSSNYPITLSDIKDGAGNTILVGEKALVVAAYNTGGWYWDEPIFAGGSGGTARGVVALPSPPAPSPNTNWGTPFYSQQAGFPPLPFNYPPGMVPDSDPNMFNNFGSAHPGGVNFLFADGSVRTFNYNVDLSLFQGLLTPAGGDPTPPES